MDLFRALTDLDSVEQVSHLNDSHVGLLTAVFYACPKMGGKGMRLNKSRTGFTTQYAAGISDQTAERIARVTRFCQEARAVGIEVAVTAIFAAADAKILFPIPVEPPEVPNLGIPTRSNLNWFETSQDLYWRFYDAAPWRHVPQRFVRLETERLVQLLPRGFAETVRPEFIATPWSPRNLAENYIARIFAGFAWDGWVLANRSGLVGGRPVILGVESPGVPVLQNAALEREDWIPVIQLH